MKALATRGARGQPRLRPAARPDREVHTLSVGERQRIEIVRCLLQSPRLLIMDEPTSVLTPQEVEQAVRDPAPARGRGRARSSTSATSWTRSRRSATAPPSCAAARWWPPATPRPRPRASMAQLMIGRGAAHADPPRRGARWARSGSPSSDLDLAVRGAARRRPEATSASRCAPARSWASPASPATARTS